MIGADGASKIPCMGAVVHDAKANESRAGYFTQRVVDPSTSRDPRRVLAPLPLR